MALCGQVWWNLLRCPRPGWGQVRAVAVTSRIAYLVTGNPGSGKSTLAHELSSRELVAIDPDHDPDLSYWEDAAGTRTMPADGPNDPDQEWLESHRWVWSRVRMEERIAEHVGPVFVRGIAMNLDQFLEMFDRVFLLRIDEGTQEARLVAHDTQSPPGRNEAERDQIRKGRAIFEAHLLTVGAIALNGAAPIAEIADELLALVTSN